MEKDDTYEEKLCEALEENKTLTQVLKDGILQIEFIKFLTVFIAIMIVIILIKVMWWN